MEKKDTNIISMLERGLQVVDYLYKNKAPMGISELAKEMKLPKATIYRLLYTLEKDNFIEKDKTTEKYALGMGFIKLGEYVKSTVNINMIAKPYMEKLAEATGETSYLCKVYYDEALVMETVSGEASALYSMVTPTIPLYCSALGRILLAGFSDKELDKYFNDANFKKRTLNTKTEKSELLEEIVKIKENGLAIEIEEYEYGMACIAAPIVDSSGKIIASLSVSGPSTRIEYKGMEGIIKQVRSTCDMITAKLS